MNILNLLAAEEGTRFESGTKDIVNQSFETFRKIINIVFPVFIGVILVIALFYGVQLGIKYAKAEEDDDKKKAKGQLINVIVGCLIAIVFVAIIEIVLNQNFVGTLFKDAAYGGKSSGTNLVN